MKRENAYQAGLIKKLKRMFPGCVVLKNDASYIQGIPDLTILFNQCWAMLECKVNKKAKRQPNQEYYVNKLNEMSFASFISPETEDLVLRRLKRFFYAKCNKHKRETA